MNTSQTERLGVQTTGLIVTKKLAWIWRELAVADFGIDGLIEQCVNGKPNGKLIAVQVKSGLGNVNEGKKEFTYYTSNTHKSYWSNYCIPVIMVLHDPISDKTYWTTADDQDFKKTTTRWKLSIPKNQELSEKSEQRLIEIFNYDQDSSDFENIFDENLVAETLFDHAAKLAHVNDSYESMMRIVGILDEIRVKINLHNNKLQEHIHNDLNDNDPQVRATIKSLSASLRTRSLRIDSELILLAQSFSETMYSLEIVTIAHFELTSDIATLIKIKESLLDIPLASKNAIEEFATIENSFRKYPKKYPSLKMAKEKWLSTIQSIKDEFNSISEITQNFIKIVERVQKG